MAQAGLEFDKRELTDDQLKWLTDLPRREIVGEEFLLVHDHPIIRDRCVYPAEFSNLRRYLDDYGGVMLGHKHTSSTRQRATTDS